MDDGSHCDYALSGFLYALNIWVLEVLPNFRCYSHHMDRRISRMLSWAPVKKTQYEIIIDNFFHAEHRFKSFQVSALVATNKERQYFPVPLQFAFGSACSSSSVGSLISRGLLDHLVDDTIWSLRKEMIKQQSTLLNLITKLESRFEGVECHVGELHNKFSDVINIIESLIHTYEESKLEGVIVERSKKAINVHDKSTSTPNVDVCCMPTEFLDLLSGKTEILSQVELDLAMEVAAMRAEEAVACAEKMLMVIF
ncbi:hypothetical protein HAX54_050074 [Datura stramonium]|uniref:Uncharacterized protein n=1 Tax=Datura stramonium TaxID=4076 RepID=A0ABS8RR34_DATST|nr:hypothetical protein [Datura stramonium]